MSFFVFCIINFVHPLIPGFDILVLLFDGDIHQDPTPCRFLLRVREFVIDRVVDLIGQFCFFAVLCEFFSLLGILGIDVFDGCEYNTAGITVWFLIASNRPVVSKTGLETRAWRKSFRHFAERSNQDSKSDFGWDEFQAIKYRAWLHQLALTLLAGWFITEIRLDWAARYQHQPDLLTHYQVELLPVLSVANVRELLRATLPLPQLSPSEAALLVIKHLDNRIRSRKSRLLHASSP